LAARSRGVTCACLKRQGLSGRARSRMYSETTRRPRILHGAVVTGERMVVQEPRGYTCADGKPTSARATTTRRSTRFGSSPGLTVR
jgi:hypothetical protein